MSRIISFGLALGMIGVSIATVASLLGPWSALADAFSHIRMHAATVSLVIAAASLAVSWRMTAAAVLLAAINVGGTLTYEKAPRSASGGGGSLKVMTLNVLYRADNDAGILAQIAQEEPDVVFLQELTAARAGLLRQLLATHPWQISCAGDGPEAAPGGWPCDVAIVSRHPWQAAEARPVGTASTKVAWARFGSEWHNALVASVHLKWPLFSDQAAQLSAIRGIVANHPGPVIVAGDLNAVAWSAAVRGFTRQSQLRSAGGFTPTWPRRTFVDGKTCLACIPQLQIDHIFVSRQITVRAVRTGTDVGSDHLPLIAELEMPRRLAAASAASVDAP